MNDTIKTKYPDVIYSEGEPKAVILDIEDYRLMLERLEDIEDLATLEEMRKKRLEFTPLEDFLPSIV
ncbi:MAG: type II toxin-antitoxin system Phd/YefM family antitoxin [Calditrichaeota bacterium]|nr:type II toxin-antitoxin system Phd/YefM family antitoxin [Calditrichota bacterium]